MCIPVFSPFLHWDALAPLFSPIPLPASTRMRFLASFFLPPPSLCIPPSFLLFPASFSVLSFSHGLPLIIGITVTFVFHSPPSSLHVLLSAHPAVSIFMHRVFSFLSEHQLLPVALSLDSDQLGQNFLDRHSDEGKRFIHSPVGSHFIHLNPSAFALQRGSPISGHEMISMTGLL